MTQIRRFLVLASYLLAALLFIVLASYAILLVSGYQADLKNRQIVKTGILSITTIPPRARVTFNHKTFTRRTPLNIKHLLPGEYDLLVEADQASPYRKKVIIRAGLVTDERILLFLTEPQREEVLPELALQQFLPLDEERILILDRENNFWVWQEGGKPRPLGQDSAILRRYSKSSLKEAKISPDKKRIALSFKGGVLLLNGKEATPLGADLTPASLGDLAFVNGGILVLKNQTLWLQEALKQKIAGLITGFLLDGSRLLVTQKENDGTVKLLELALNGNLLNTLSERVPTGTSHSILLVEGELFIVSRSRNVSTLWLYQDKNNEFQRLLGNFRAPLLATADDFILPSQTELAILERKLLRRSLESQEEASPLLPHQITALATPISLLSAVRSNLFFLQGNALRTITTDGSGLLTLLTIGQSPLFLSKGGDQALVLEKGQLVRYGLRKS